MEEDDDDISIREDDSDAMDVDSEEDREWRKWRRQRKLAQKEDDEQERQEYETALAIAKEQNTKLPYQRQSFFDRLTRESKFYYVLDPSVYDKKGNDRESIVNLRLQLADEMWNEYNATFLNGTEKNVALFNMTTWARDAAKQDFYGIQRFFFDLACQRFLQYMPDVAAISSPLWSMLYAHGIQYEWEPLDVPAQSLRLDRRVADLVYEVLRVQVVPIAKATLAVRRKKKDKGTKKEDRLWAPTDFQVLTFEEVSTSMRHGEKSEIVKLFAEFVTPSKVEDLFYQVMDVIREISEREGIQNPSKYAVVRKENVAEIRVSARRPALPSPPAPM